MDYIGKKVNRGTFDYAAYGETEGVMGDSNAWIDERERPRVYIRRFVGPRRRVYVCRTNITNHAVKSRDGVTKRKPAEHQNSMSKSTNFRPK